jgi:hypothetical protein
MERLLDHDEGVDRFDDAQIFDDVDDCRMPEPSSCHTQRVSRIKRCKRGY